MAPQTPYPRATVKRIVKAHSNRPLSKNADVMVFLDYVLFLEECVVRLIREASTASKAAGERQISAAAVRKVRGKTLDKFKG